VSQYSHEKNIHIYVGTFNLNGQTSGINDDLSQWLCPPFLGNSQLHPELVVVGFQEIVQLSPQQIMSTDPARRQLWEQAVLKALNSHARATGGREYVLLRGGQLVGAALLIYVKTSAIGQVRNVEGSLKKVGYCHSKVLVAPESFLTVLPLDRYVRCRWKQRSCRNPHGICKYSTMFRHGTSCCWIFELRRTKPRLQDHRAWIKVPARPNYR